MIDHDIVHAGFRSSVKENVVAGVVLHIAAHAHAQVTKNNVVRAVDAPDSPVAVRQPGPFDLHAVRGGLPSHGEIRCAHLDCTFQRDCTADPEYADARAGSLHASAQTTRP